MTGFDPLYYPYPSRRQLVYAARGMVATSQPLAAQAGLRVLIQGGNAIDAAIAAAACLTVVEPTSNGIGSDAFAIVWSGGRMYGLNASGPAPASLTIGAVTGRGHESMPALGVLPVTVPGAPAAWAALARRFGRLPLARSLQPACEYAEEGYPLSPVVAHNWRRAVDNGRERFSGPEFAGWFETFTMAGRAPEPGETWRSPGHARTLRRIGETDARDFYEGETAEAVAAFMRAHDGYLTVADLASFEPEWVEPLSVPCGGFEVWELPPNGQGLVALQALQILRHLPWSGGGQIEHLHARIEAVKLAFADGLRYIAEPAYMPVSPSALLCDDYARERAALIGERAGVYAPGRPVGGGTVYLAAADRDGNMVSYIQSNYLGFGSGIVVPGTGISLQNRGHLFSLDPGHPNALSPGKRPYHTIIPGFLTRRGNPVGPFGIMGGFMQPQAHVQVLSSVIHEGLNPQAALDAPRWQWLGGLALEVEPHFPAHLVQALERRGHDVKVARDSGSFGRGQIVWRDERGTLVGATEARADGEVAAW